jgi:tRNA pseudouridine13 synthase
LKFSKSFEKLRHTRIKVLESFRSREKLNIGDLKGNNFFIRLKDVGEEASEKMIEILDDIMRNGMPNYFGYQRFGKDSSNFEKARDVAQGELIMKDKKVHKIMLHAYQSYLFNDWLVERIKLSEEEAYSELELNEEQLKQLKDQKGLLKVLPGDIMQDSKGKFVNVTDLQEIRKPYKEHKLTPTGLLAGSKVWRSKGVAGDIEQHFDDLTVNAMGIRRDAWIYPKQIRYKHNQKEKFLELSFTLPKGSYATVLLENIANRDLSPNL